MNIEQEQRIRLTRIDEEFIPRGASVPVELLLDWLHPGANVAEFGGGTGEKPQPLFGTESKQISSKLIHKQLNPHADEELFRISRM